MKNSEEIKAKIKSIKEEYAKLPPYSAFGDNNYKIRDAIIFGLEQCLTLSKGEIEKRIDLIYSDYDETSEEFSDSDENERNHRISPYEWVLGHIDDI